MISPEKPDGEVRDSTSVPERLYAALVSPRLAIALLVGVLICCVVGVTVYRGERAWALIFSTLWFNALLVLLAISSAAAFFSRIWRRKLTLVSAGMILFHLSFVGVLAGTVYNSLFHFKGAMRLTEGESLPNGEYSSYDTVEAGRFFDFGRLRGTTTLLRMHTGYKVEGKDKRAAYEIEVGEGGSKTTGIIYITHDLEHDGVRYLCSMEGYSVLVTMSAKDGTELYGGHIPLQSLRQPDGTIVYTTDSFRSTAGFEFPAPPEQPRFELRLIYRPNAVKERSGDVAFEVVPLGDAKGRAVASRKGTVPVEGKFDAGDFLLSPLEIRYWVSMDVRHDPGLTLVLTSLCFGLGGMVLTFVARVRQGAAKRRVAEDRKSVV